MKFLTFTKRSNMSGSTTTNGKTNKKKSNQKKSSSNKKCGSNATSAGLTNNKASANNSSPSEKSFGKKLASILSFKKNKPLPNKVEVEKRSIDTDRYARAKKCSDAFLNKSNIKYHPTVSEIERMKQNLQQSQLSMTSPKIEIDFDTPMTDEERAQTFFPRSGSSSPMSKSAASLGSFSTNYSLNQDIPTTPSTAPSTPSPPTLVKNAQYYEERSRRKYSYAEIMGDSSSTETITMLSASSIPVFQMPVNLKYKRRFNVATNGNDDINEIQLQSIEAR